MQAASVRPRYFWPVAMVILWAGLGLRIWNLGGPSLWWDEILTELRAQASLKDAFTMILESGNQTPLYYILLHLIPTHTEFLLRLPSVGMGVIGIALLMLVAQRLYSSYPLTLGAGALLAFNPYHIWLSQTARPYAMLFVFSLLASYYFLLLLRGDRSRTNWVLFTLSSMAAYMTHYVAVAIPLAQYVLFAFILRGNRGFFRRWIAAQLIAGLPLMIWIFALSQQETVAFGIGWIPRPGLQDIPLTLWSMTIGYDGAVSLGGKLAWYVPFGLAAVGVGLLAGLWVAVRERRANRVDFYWFWLIAAPFILVFVVSNFRPLYVDRYFMVFLPAVLLLTLIGWKQLPRPGWPVGLAAVTLLVSLTNVLVTFHQGENQKEDWRGAAEYIAQNFQPGDALLCETPVEIAALERYLNRDEIPHAWLVDAPGLQEQYKTPVRRIWVAYRNPHSDVHRQGAVPGFDPFAPSDSPLYGWLQKHRDQVVPPAQRVFSGVTVLLVDVGEAGY